jgi:hypothetical protein
MLLRYALGPVTIKLPLRGFVKKKITLFLVINLVL